MKKRTKICLGGVITIIVVIALCIAPTVWRYSSYREARLIIESGNEAKAIELITKLHKNPLFDLDWTIREFIDSIPYGDICYNKLVRCSHCKGDFYTLLYYSALNGHERLTRLMIESGASSEGFNLLNASIGSGNRSLVKYVIDSGVDINSAESMLSAIHGAVLPWQSMDMINILLDHGADINATNKDGWTPLDVACTWNTNIIPDLIALGATLGTNRKRPLPGKGEDVAKRITEMHNQRVEAIGGPRPPQPHP